MEVTYGFCIVLVVAVILKWLLLGQREMAILI